MSGRGKITDQWLHMLLRLVQSIKMLVSSEVLVLIS